MPDGVVLSVTMRRCVRVGKNEGRLLKDLGIKPGLVYRMTFRDVTDRNQDLMTRATLELSGMPAYELDMKVSGKGDVFRLTCRTLNLEVFSGERQQQPADARTMVVRGKGSLMGRCSTILIVQVVGRGIHW